MKIEIKPLPAGLHFVATPIGAARDITLRALDTLASADVLAAEDTRTLRRLMEIHGVDLRGRPLIAYHDHNGKMQRPRLLAMIADGKSVAYASEAGTPLVADPGYTLGVAVREAGHFVTTAPGPVAAIAALTVSGLASDRFFFAGFLPPASGARKSAAKSLADIPGTLIFYESPKRLHKMLADLEQTLGGTRRAVVCRELTKKFEDVVSGTLAELAERYAGQAVKGEIVVLVARGQVLEASEDELKKALRKSLERLSLKDAATEVAEAYGRPRRQVYQLGLMLEEEE